MEKEINKIGKGDVTEKINKNLDLIIATGGVLLGIFIIYLSLTYGIHQYDIGGTIFIASALYLLLRNCLKQAKLSISTQQVKLYISITLSFFLLSV
jgi:hypothetical protein